jgi:hypothetical protein
MIQWLLSLIAGIGLEAEPGFFVEQKHYPSTFRNKFQGE